MTMPNHARSEPGHRGLIAIERPRGVAELRSSRRSDVVTRKLNTKNYAKNNDHCPAEHPPDCRCSCIRRVRPRWLQRFLFVIFIERIEC